MDIKGMNITFNELRKIKDNLPDGSIHQIADSLSVSVETVRNYFGGYNYQDGQAVGIHFEPGPDGGVVHLDDTRIIEMAQKIIDAQVVEIES